MQLTCQFLLMRISESTMRPGCITNAMSCLAQYFAPHGLIQQPPQGTSGATGDGLSHITGTKAATEKTMKLMQTYKEIGDAQDEVGPILGRGGWISDAPVPAFQKRNMCANAALQRKQLPLQAWPLQFVLRHGWSFNAS